VLPSADILLSVNLSSIILGEYELQGGDEAVGCTVAAE